MESPMMRSLPQSIEAEQSVIGAMIIDKSAIAQVFEKLNEDDFYRDGHKVIYKAIREMYAKDMAVDLVTILEYLKTTDMLDKAGGVTYISELSSSVPTTANLSSYIKIVEEKSTLRKLIKASTSIIEESYNSGGDVEKVIDLAENNDFPIFTIPWNVPLLDFFEELGHAISYLDDRKDIEDSLLAEIIFGNCINTSSIEQKCRQMGNDLGMLEQVFVLH